ncbi:helix-turn-helix domain-containing protein [Streptomyces sp. NBC_00237]|uniref:helix-turn-helix transcriptional regulator n=1 Tax=Streptomyces sp. NBC_00237 TaxID=2975687 RepID=UPI00224CA86D|nr:helix-turn-helix domain-containing protein [Streptomyces sp. NBC_00237]MCX5206079.1 helix-turn-helix domain-containing protein [Streptomyces sp. NBC_00237]
MSGTIPGFHNPAAWEQLPNAGLTSTARDIFDILQARQAPGGDVRIKQSDLAARLGIHQASVSRAMSELRDTGLIEGRTRHGRVLIHPLFAGYQSYAHMINHIEDPDTHIWPLRFASGDVRPPRRSDPRTGTEFDPDPNGGEPAPAVAARPNLRLAG